MSEFVAKFRHLINVISDTAFVLIGALVPSGAKRTRDLIAEVRPESRAKGLAHKRSRGVLEETGRFLESVGGPTKGRGIKRKDNTYEGGELLRDAKGNPTEWVVDEELVELMRAWKNRTNRRLILPKKGEKMALTKVGEVDEILRAIWQHEIRQMSPAEIDDYVSRNIRLMGLKEGVTVPRDPDGFAQFLADISVQPATDSTSV